MSSADSRSGLVAVLGSGETADTGRLVFERVLGVLDRPARVAILETPAGFQPNSRQVADEMAQFLAVHLQNRRPDVTVVPARARGTADDPDDPALCDPLCDADVLYLGAGSPTYASRQLLGTFAWHALVGRHREGAAVVLASAAALACSARVLPVYEIFKAGEDLHWRPGLDLLGPYGPRVALIPHWDNNDGGTELDTSHCFMGRLRFLEMLELLPPGFTVVGVDENTAMIIDPAREVGEVIGLGGVTLQCAGTEVRYEAGTEMPLSEIGGWHAVDPAAGLRPDVLAALARRRTRSRRPGAKPAPAVTDLVERREAARQAGDWDTADSLRDELAALGWAVRDTKAGPELEKVGR